MCDEIISEIKRRLKNAEDRLNRSKTREDAELRNLQNIQTDCETTIAKLTALQTSLKEWTEKISEKEMTAERGNVLTEELKELELTLGSFDEIEYDLQKLHSQSTARLKDNASYQSHYQGSLVFTIQNIDITLRKFARGNADKAELSKLRERSVQMICVSQNIAERFQRFEGPYSDKRLTDFNDQLDKVCREFNAVRSRHITRIHRLQDAAANTSLSLV